jgi:hypothetical protein
VRSEAFRRSDDRDLERRYPHSGTRRQVHFDSITDPLRRSIRKLERVTLRNDGGLVGTNPINVGEASQHEPANRGVTFGEFEEELGGFHVLSPDAWAHVASGAMRGQVHDDVRCVAHGSAEKQRPNFPFASQVSSDPSDAVALVSLFERT